jgi:hypothetical protein
VKVAVPSVMIVGPTTLAARALTGTGAASAVDAGAAMAIMLMAAATAARWVRVGFMSNLFFRFAGHVHIDRPAAAGVAPVVLGT